MKTNQKVPFPLWKTIVCAAVSAVVAVALIVGTCVAYNYQLLLDVFFSKSDYSVTETEKEKCDRKKKAVCWKVIF